MLVILGAGYTGRYIYAQALAQGLSVLVTSRAHDAHLTFASPLHRIEFDLDRKDTWRHIPAGADLIWCFPAMPLETVSTFAETELRKARRIVVLSSTSAYEMSAHDRDSVIDECTPVNRTFPRVLGEEYLRTQRAAVILRVAGIYGPGRNVLDWIRRGKVAPSQRYVNLIHVHDLAAICLSALEEGRSGEIYNVSDGQPRRWSEICDVAQVCWGVVPAKREEDQRAGKRLSIAKLMRDFHVRFHCPDLYAALDAIERATSNRPPGAPTA